MKKILVVGAVLALAGTQPQTARAGDCEWATAGKILTGVAVGAVIASAVNARADCSVTYYSGPGYAYCPPPASVVCAPPVMYMPRPVVGYRPLVVCAPPVVAGRYGHGYRHGHGPGPHDRW